MFVRISKIYNDKYISDIIRINLNLGGVFMKFTWNDSMILDKLQEILDGKNLDELELTVEELEDIKLKLSESISDEELHESSYLIANNIEELKLNPSEEIKDYILRLINYLNDNSFNSIIGEYNGIEFEVYKHSNVDDVFNDYYSKYDEIYGISDMLYDLGLK